MTTRSLRNLFALAANTLIKRKHFIIYSIIGVSGASLDLLAFILMTKFIPIHYLFVNAISTTVGITNNFILNAHFNFAVKTRLLSRFLSFFAVGLLGMAAASGILFVLVDLVKVAPGVAKFLVIVIIVLLQYNLNKRFSFGQNCNS
jgi:putative flippase GtrA